MGTNNNTGDFLRSLATNHNSSKTQIDIMIARKKAERQRSLQRMRRHREVLRRTARALATEEIGLRAIETDLLRLEEESSRAEDDW